MVLNSGKPTQAPRPRLTMALAALGVVYGDLGTSPLYALRQCFRSTANGVTPTPENVLGVLSLIFWALTLVVIAKYLTVVMRADNRGEGGILALLALLRGQRPPADPEPNYSRAAVFALLGVFGTALLLADGMLTPAISVLSAVEGLELAEPALDHLVMPITVVILVALFRVQRHGTARIASVFGPTMLALAQRPHRGDEPTGHPGDDPHLFRDGLAATALPGAGGLDPGIDHRVAGADLRRLFAGRASGAARLFAAFDDR